MKYRVDELAARSGTSVDTIRFYQSKGLLPQPQRDGRVAWYGEGHLERLRRIRDLKDRGFTLRSIRGFLDKDLDPADEALIAEVIGTPRTSGVGAARLTLDELAERTGVSPALLEAIEREGLLVPERVDGSPRYTEADAGVVAAGLELLSTGLPLGELLALAREHDEAMRAVAGRAVEMFVRFVRDPIRAAATSDEEAADRLVEAFRKMLPATASLVSHHFQRVLLTEAEVRIEREGVATEIEAVRVEAGRSAIADG
ncbi:MAG: MerR family transcriptional regulator [Actinomycetota bacterium]